MGGPRHICDIVDDKISLDNAYGCGFGPIEKIVDEQICLASKACSYGQVACSADICLW